jgi:hypothetical protein
MNSGRNPRVVMAVNILQDMLFRCVVLCCVVCVCVCVCVCIFNTLHYSSGSQLQF